MSSRENMTAEQKKDYFRNIVAMACSDGAIAEREKSLLNYVAHVRLIPVTDGDHTFWQWDCRFDAPEGRAGELAALVGDNIYQAGFDAIRAQLGLEGA